MRTRTLLLIVLIGFGVLALFCWAVYDFFFAIPSVYPGPPGYTLVDTYVGSDVHWSSDGHALYYDKARIWRYDLRSGSKRELPLPEGSQVYSFDISPDEKAMVCNVNGTRLDVLDVASGKVRTIYSSSGRMIAGGWWLAGGRVAFYPPHSSRIHIMELRTRKVTLLPASIAAEFPDSEGKGFYRSAEKNGSSYLHYDLATKRATRTPARSVRTTRFPISPDRRHEWYLSEGGRGDWYNREPSSLWIKSRKGK